MVSDKAKKIFKKLKTKKILVTRRNQKIKAKKKNIHIIRNKKLRINTLDFNENDEDMIENNTNLNKKSISSNIDNILKAHENAKKNLKKESDIFYHFKCILKKFENDEKKIKKIDKILDFCEWIYFFLKNKNDINIYSDINQGKSELDDIIHDIKHYILPSKKKIGSNKQRLLEILKFLKNKERSELEKSKKNQKPENLEQEDSESEEEESIVSEWGKKKLIEDILHNDDKIKQEYLSIDEQQMRTIIERTYDLEDINLDLFLFGLEPFGTPI